MLDDFAHLRAKRPELCFELTDATARRFELGPALFAACAFRRAQDARTNNLRTRVRNGRATYSDLFLRDPRRRQRVTSIERRAARSDASSIPSSRIDSSRSLTVT
jgi:hypothetical protein